MTQFPERAGELLDYSHTIHSIRETYTWNNVYRYKKEFRIHMEHNPERNWGVILHKAWSLCWVELLSRIGVTTFVTNTFNQTRKDGQTKPKLCFKFNKVECTYGNNSKFGHKCVVCNRYRHRAFSCRKLVGNNSLKQERKKVLLSPAGELI